MLLRSTFYQTRITGSKSSILKAPWSLQSMLMDHSVLQVDSKGQCLRRSSRLLASSRQVIVSSPETISRKRKYLTGHDSSSDVSIETAEEVEALKYIEGKRQKIQKTSSKKKGNDQSLENASPTRTRKKREPKPEPIYVIPEVVVKDTTFKGRLGYACLNTILRNRKPAADATFCSRTCRLDSIRKNGIEWVKELGRKNVQDLATILEWNEKNSIRFFRLSSEMFPFASHGVHGYSLDYCAPELATAGNIAKKYGHRLTTHPGQFTQLGSPKPGVVEASIRDLAYHCQMLDLLGTGSDSVMIIHGGGVYGDKPSTLERLKENIRNLPKNIRDRLVLENDEMCYNAKDLLPLCEELGIPLVFDYHHDSIFPSSIPPKIIIQRADAIWKRRGIRPKQHLSEQRPGAVTIMERRAHADRCENLPPDLPDDMDLMIEAKDKEQAVLYLHRLYNLQPVIYESLRPANANPSKQTAGRKSMKSSRVTDAKEILDEDKIVKDDVSVLSSCASDDEEVLVDQTEPNVDPQSQP